MMSAKQNTLYKSVFRLMFGLITFFLSNDQPSQVQAFNTRLKSTTTTKFTLLHQGPGHAHKKCERLWGELRMSSKSTLQDLIQNEAHRIKRRDSDRMATTIIAFFLSSWIIQKRLPIFSTIISLVLFVGNNMMKKNRIQMKNRYGIKNYTTTNKRQNGMLASDQKTQQASTPRSRYHLAEIAAREEKRAFFGKKWVEETLRCNEEIF